MTGIREDGIATGATSPSSVDARSMDMTPGALYTSLSVEVRRDIVLVGSEPAEKFDAWLERPVRLGSSCERGIVPPFRLDQGEIIGRLNVMSGNERV